MKNSDWIAGLEPEKLEVQLAMYLQRAERWNAMVLMDEADVYMSKRLSHSARTETGIVSGKILLHSGFYLRYS